MVSFCNGVARRSPTQSRIVSRVGSELSMVLNQIPYDYIEEVTDSRD